MSFWSSDLAEPGPDELAEWLRNIEGASFGGYDVDPSVDYYPETEPSENGESAGEDEAGEAGAAL